MTDEDTPSIEVSEVEAYPHYHPGVPDGTIDSNGETIVFEYDDAGNHVGWHKVPKEEV